MDWTKPKFCGKNELSGQAAKWTKMSIYIDIVAWVSGSIAVAAAICTQLYKGQLSLYQMGRVYTRTVLWALLTWGFILLGAFILFAQDEYAINIFRAVLYVEFIVVHVFSYWSALAVLYCVCEQRFALCA